jgi:lysine 2,3-aminomutase
MEQQESLNRRFQLLAKEENLLPIKVTGFYRRKIEEEFAALGHHNGPLHRGVYPSEERLQVRAPGEVADFVDDRVNMPDGLKDVAVRKYDNRMLFFPTDVCAAHCQYCFRQDVLSELHEGQEESATIDGKLNNLLTYLEGHPEVEEVILSGGDPMTLSYQRLEKILRSLQEAKVRNIRIHTRTLIFSPKVFKKETIDLLAGTKARLVMHSIHPYEICDEVEDYIRQLDDAGVRLYNQFPLLRKVNDHPEVLRRHLVKLDELGVRNLSMFIPDPINFSASFRIRLKRLFAIIDELNWSTASWVNSTRVVLDTHHGKVRREDLKSYDEASGIAIFERQGNSIQYTDLPEALDEPGDIKTLLWKDA